MQRETLKFTEGRSSLDHYWCTTPPPHTHTSSNKPSSGLTPPPQPPSPNKRPGRTTALALRTLPAPPQVSSTVLPELRHVWQHIAFCANTVLFFLCGTITFAKLREGHIASDPAEWASLFLLYGIVHAARGATILVSYPLLRRSTYGFDVRRAILLWWSGLRGAIGLALGLLVLDDTLFPVEVREQVMFQVGPLPRSEGRAPEVGCPHSGLQPAPPPPPPNVCQPRQFVGISGFCRFCWVSGFCRFVLPICWDFCDSGPPDEKVGREYTLCHGPSQATEPLRPPFPPAVHPFLNCSAGFWDFLADSGEGWGCTH